MTMIREIILPTAELIMHYDRRISGFPFLANGTKDLLEAVVDRHIVKPDWFSDPSTQFVYRMGKYYGRSITKHNAGVVFMLEDWADREGNLDIGEYLMYLGQVEMLLDFLDADFRDILKSLFGKQRIRIVPHSPTWIFDNLKIRYEPA